MRILVCGRLQLAGLTEKGRVALVSISDDPNDFPQIPAGLDCCGVLQLHFHDVEIDLDSDFDFFKDSKKFSSYTPAQARSVAAFVLGSLDIDTIVFQCEAGISRSAAMAAATARHLGMDDMRFFRDYLPNRLVYRLTLEQLDPQVERAGGGVVCSTCGKAYYDHPNHPAFPWITVLCDDSNVKL